MECFRRLFCHWQPDGYCHEPYPAILYVRFHTYDGLTYYSLYGAGFLEKYEKIYLGG